MILSGPEIEAAIRRGKVESNWTSDYRTWIHLPVIRISPFSPERVGPNSYDVTLGDTLLTYKDEILDLDQENETEEIKIPARGYVLVPGELYLGHIVERTITSGCVPYIDGRSSVGRKGISVHVTAGRGDDAFGEDTEDALGCSWTLEITVQKKIRVRPGAKIGQLTFHTLLGRRKRYSGRYKNQVGGPVASRYHQK